MKDDNTDKSPVEICNVKINDAQQVEIVKTPVVNNYTFQKNESI
jgi:hypothetical protein